MLDLPPAFMLSLIKKALDTTPSQWARSERRVSHAADHIFSWRRCSKPKTNGRVRTLGTTHGVADIFTAPFSCRFEFVLFSGWKRQNDTWVTSSWICIRCSGKINIPRWWLIHLIYRRIFLKTMKPLFAWSFFGGAMLLNNLVRKSRTKNQKQTPAAQTASARNSASYIFFSSKNSKNESWTWTTLAHLNRPSTLTKCHSTFGWILLWLLVVILRQILGVRNQSTCRSIATMKLHKKAHWKMSLHHETNSKSLWN